MNSLSALSVIPLGLFILLAASLILEGLWKVAEAIDRQTEVLKAGE